MRAFLAVIALLLAGCLLDPAEDVDFFVGPLDDDDATADDDDATADDDDAATDDLLDAFIPTFDGGCTGNRFKAVLGDGTELTEVEGFLEASSFSSDAPPEQSFRIRLGAVDGVTPDALWVQIAGERADLTGPGPYDIRAPDVPARINVNVGADHAAAPMSGGFGVPLLVHDDVQGSVAFTAGDPVPNAPISGTYEAILQGGSPGLENPAQVILLGIAGCFTDVTLTESR